MTVQKSPTYLGWYPTIGGWGVSPSYMRDAAIVYNVSDWTFEDVVEFINSNPSWRDDREWEMEHFPNGSVAPHDKA